MPIKVIMTSQELDQHSEIPTTKQRAISSLKRPKNRGKRLFPSYIKE